MPTKEETVVHYGKGALSMSVTVTEQRHNSLWYGIAGKEWNKEE